MKSFEEILKEKLIEQGFIIDALPREIDQRAIDTCLNAVKQYLSESKKHMVLLYYCQDCDRFLNNYPEHNADHSVRVEQVISMNVLLDGLQSVADKPKEKK